MKINAEVRKQTRLQGLEAGVVMRVKTNPFNSHDVYVLCVYNVDAWLLVDLDTGTIWGTVQGGGTLDLRDWIIEFNEEKGQTISVCEQAEMEVISYE